MKFLQAFTYIIGCGLERIVGTLEISIVCLLCRRKSVRKYLKAIYLGDYTQNSFRFARSYEFTGDYK